ncbi:4'-phosphopantetheinyl transferase superfamily protein [Salinisphaera sp. SPP-AMP-43]|uniref:4'-phosphopantetheinyl transferase family protein n=1 Tax=Salinisphaera sp. SPP-AMP-43 TaxID=3121288 RepID=UPI003C6E009D
MVWNEETAAEQLQAGLSAAERARYQQLTSAPRQRQYLASRWLLRHQLATELGASPTELDIVYPAGRPPYSRDTSLSLGLAHSGSACLSLLATSTRAGCDIESVRPRRFAPERLAEQYFHADEARDLAAAPDAERLADFYRLWTLKEAHLKALGLGLAAGLDRAIFSLRPRLVCRQALTTEPWLYGALELPLGTEHCALAVASAPAAEIRLERFYTMGADAPCRQPITRLWETASIAA